MSTTSTTTTTSQTTTTTAARPPTTPVPTPRTLDELARLDLATLEAVYRNGTVPASLHALDGSPTCRMLAVRYLDQGGAFEAIRRFAASNAFPWAGKSFEAKSDTEGTGINRVRLGGTRTWFPFDTRVEPSVLDGQPCILLDYDRDPNPRPIRMIRDELREVAPGLFLGPAILSTKEPRLVLFFACDCSGN